MHALTKQANLNVAFNYGPALGCIQGRKTHMTSTFFEPWSIHDDR